MGAGNSSCCWWLIRISVEPGSGTFFSGCLFSHPTDGGDRHFFFLRTDSPL